MMLGGGNGGHEGSKEKPKLGDKVYTRKSFKGLKSYNSNPTQELQAQGQTEEDDEWSQPLVNSLPNAALESSSSLNRALAAPLGSRGVPGGKEGGKLGFSRQENRVTISLSMKSKQEMRELRRKLQSELDTIRSLVKNIESKEIQKNDHIIDKAGGAKKVPAEAATTVTPRERPLHQLSVSVLENSHGVSDNAEKEKRTPKANQFYRNSDFLLAKDKIPHAESNKKTKSNVKKVGGVESGHSFGLGKSSNQVFKNCCALLERLMKHKHGWVFNKPVDTAGLGLHDYFDIIKHPMDLGTVKSRLDSNRYKSPIEFAEDVRLTFQNAMTYNPKGQDVYVMAEQLLQIFENKWPAIEADYMRELRLAVDYDVGLPTPTSRKGPKLPNPEMRKKFGRSESMTLPTDPKSKPMNPPGRTPAPKKPKAKDPNKRDMTYDEKQKLSMNLQNLPSEKLENVVQIIKKRNSSLSQHDDEIEVDIDSVDTETLWELDRFVTNYKKSLSKNKRKAENPEPTATQPIKEIEQNVREKKNPPVVVETTTEALNKTPTESKAEGKDISSAPAEEEKLENNAAKSSSSSTDSGSSSSDSHSESSSEGGSDTEHSPRS